MAKAELVASDEYAEQINWHHDEGFKTGKKAFEHWFECGRLLMDKRAETKHGEFTPWLEGNSLSFGPDQARRYMRYYKKTVLLGGKRDAKSSLPPESGDYSPPIDDVTDLITACKMIGSGGDTIATKHTGEQEWYTPEKYILAVHEVMGGVDLDPASNEKANEVVKADAYYTQEFNGLEAPWHGRVYLNPPYKMPLIEQFVFKLCDEVKAKHVKQAILLTNNSTDPKWWQRAAGECTSICFPSHRIAFYDPNNETSSPTNGQCFCYFGNRRAKFAKVFSKFGWIGVRV